ncbi:dienelactone hydrolase family protein [Variovorax sp. PCZ-1]|uniref:dienelactone hydrolase family protein n=1 Tax=Variovorax sp. PCZ-1 TaxID=2835533 RepID=UPI001BCB70BD|nr:dienelactone hydrolase family protein [Variovorax sp. PCZ-1]MBS7808360.1 dienelactone hydrolase family protein [Variovorax sp. PCZ-1]
MASFRYFFSKWILCGGWIWFAVAMAAHAQTVEVQAVNFRTASQLPNTAEQAEAKSKGQTAQPVLGDELKAYLAKPAGPGPFGAVVALHGCGGMSERFKQEMTDRYNAWGYVVLVVDSFANHPVKFACGADRARSRADMRPFDAMGAMQYLAGLPYVDPQRIALLGSSQGSWVALEVASTRKEPIFDNPKNIKAQAVVAYYPDCRSTFDTFDVPVLIMVGDLDDWTPASRCQDMLQRRAGKGAPVELVVYPGARHAFDWIDLQPARRVAGYLMEYNAEAAKLSMDKHREFLKQTIGSK